MGTRLPSLLRSAGLEPQLPYEVAGGVVTGDDAVLQFLLAMLVGIAPVLTGNGIASEKEVDADSFATCQGRDWPRPGAVIVFGPSLAVWAKSRSASPRSGTTFRRSSASLLGGRHLPERGH